MFAEIPKLLAFIGTPEWKRQGAGKAAPTRRSVDDGKVTDHHALLVTGEKPLFLSKEDNTIYQMIAGRMIEAFSEMRQDVTAVTAECAGVEFAVKRQRRETSRMACRLWRRKRGNYHPRLAGRRHADTGRLVHYRRDQAEAAAYRRHPAVGNGDGWQEIEDDALRQAMKDCGIGTPATRAAVIETLFKRGYMERCKKSLVPTEKGACPQFRRQDDAHRRCCHDGRMGKELARIERGNCPPALSAAI